MSAVAQKTRIASVDVLVVEDEDRLRDVILRALPEMGFTGAGATRIDEARHIMRTHEVHVLLLDVRLDGDDGLEWLESLRAQSNEIPAVLMTAYADVPGVQRALRSGAADFLTKPFKLHQLEAALSRAYRKVVAMQEVKMAKALVFAEPESTSEELPMVDEVRRRALHSALEQAGGNKQRAAEMLGISRRTLYNWLERYQD
jgi:DNA-binding NtrC family response regulator